MRAGENTPCFFLHCIVSTILFRTTFYRNTSLSTYILFQKMQQADSLSYRIPMIINGHNDIYILLKHLG